MLIALLGFAVVLCFGLIGVAMVQMYRMAEPECPYAVDELLVQGINPCVGCSDTECVYELVERV